MMQVISNAQFWLIIGFIMLVIEMFSLSFFAFFIAVGALLTALLSYVGVLPTWTWQIVFFSISSVLSLIFLRKVIKKNFSKTKDGKDYLEFVGERAKVTKAIPANEIGRILYRGTEWDAKNEDGKSYEVGEQVTIIKMDGITAIIS